MSLPSTITVDQAANTVTLNCLSAGNPVDALTYTLSTNTVSFGIRPLISISATDYITLATQIALFQSAIIANFNINQFVTSPLTSFTETESHVTTVHTNQWILSVTVNSTQFINNIAEYSTQLVTLMNRTSTQTLNYSEWALTLSAINHYGISVKSFFGL